MIHTFLGLIAGLLGRGHASRVASLSWEHIQQNRLDVIEASEVRVGDSVRLSYPEGEPVEIDRVELVGVDSVRLEHRMGGQRWLTVLSRTAHVVRVPR